MTKEEKENELRRFFRSLLYYGLGNAVLILIWLFFDRGSFWPFWTIVVFGVPLLIDAIKLQVFPESYNKKAEEALKKVTEVTEDYEEKFVDHMKNLDKKMTQPKTPSATKKAVAKKPEVKKPEPKKPAAKKAPAKKATSAKSKPTTTKKKAPAVKAAEPKKK